MSLCQSEKDLDIVESFQKALETDRKISVRVIKGKNYYVLSVNSNKIFEDLNKWGVTQNKSLITKFPDFISDDLMPHFIRGYFDGDGSVWEGKRKIVTVKNEYKPGTTRDRIIQNVKFNLTGSNDFITGLQSYLVEHVGFTKTKLNYSKSKKEHKHCTLEYSGRKNMKRFYDYIYKNATVFGERKNNKFKKILNNE